jgi:hypothetical protein
MLNDKKKNQFFLKDHDNGVTCQIKKNDMS